MKILKITCVLSTIAILAAGLQAATTRNSTQDGDWMLPGTWKENSAPNGGNIVIMHTVTMNTTTTGEEGTMGSSFFIGSGTTAGLGKLIIGSNGTLDRGVQAGGSITVARHTDTNAQDGWLELDGGTLLHLGALSVGTNATANTRNGTVVVKQNSRMEFGGIISVGSNSANPGTEGQTGDLQVIGSGSTIKGGTLNINKTGTLSFTFDETGISEIEITGAVTFDSDAILKIDGQYYTGGFRTFDLITATSITGLNIESLNATNLGFNTALYDAYLSLSQDGDVLSLTIGAIPEPATYALISVIGALAIVLYRRRK